jgi:hypothetical protein
LQSGPGSLPAGTLFNSTNGLISGTPTVTGSFPLIVTITDSSSPAKSTVTHPTVNVAAPLVITTATLPNAYTDSGSPALPYSGQLQTSGGSGTTTFSIISGALPSTIALNAATGALTSTAVTDAAQTYNFTVQAVNAGPPSSTATQPLSITVVPYFTATTPNQLPAGTVNVPYAQNITSAGGVPPYSYSLYSGNPPAGLNVSSLNATTGQISGTPTQPVTSDMFSVKVLDSSVPPQSYIEQFTVTINPAAPYVLNFTTEPGNETTNQVIPTFVAQLTQGGAPISGATVSLTFANAACSSAALSGNPSVSTDSNGNATFNNVFVNQGGVGYTLTATSTAPSATATSSAFNAPGFCATNPLNAVRSDHAAVEFPNGTVLVAGGGGSNGNPLNTAEIYTPGVGFALTAHNMQSPRAAFTATLLTSGPNAGSVLLAGGIADDNGNGTATVELFNPSIGTFTTGAYQMSVPRYGHSATLLANGDVLIAGGSSSFGNDHQTAEIYHAADGTFSSPITMTSIQVGATATLLPNGQVLLAGGQMLVPYQGGGEVEQQIATAELFNPATNTFTATGSLNVARTQHFATLLPNGQVLVAAGSNASNTAEGSAELYDPSAGTFTFTGSMTPTVGPSGTVLPNGQVLVAGGTAAGQTSQAQLFNPATGVFTIIPPMISARSGFPVIPLNNGTVLVPGGYANGATIALSELYFPDPPSGIQVTTPSPLPTALTNSPYTQFLEEQGGVGPLSWSSPNLPEGMTLSQSGVLSGSPVPPAGSTNITVQVSDSSNPPQSTSTVLVFNVATPIQITTTSLPDAPTQNGAPPGTSNVGYSTSVATTGGAGGATTYSVTSGALPSSMTLNSATGVISASNVTDAPQTFNFTIQAVSAGPPSSSTSQALSIRIVPLFYGTTSNTLPNGTANTPYSQPITSGGGISPYTYSFAYGSLPPGLNVVSTGALSGTPTTAGTYMFTITASDSSSPPQVYYEQFTITIQ